MHTHRNARTTEHGPRLMIERVGKLVLADPARFWTAARAAGRAAGDAQRPRQVKHERTLW